MSSKVLLPESVAREDGSGPEVELESSSTALLLTLGITRIVEKEILDLSVWGSTDGKIWKQIAAFPRKFYCGTYSLVLDLAHHPGIRRLRAQWYLKTWDETFDDTRDRQESQPLFGFYLHAEDVKLRSAGAA